jgi:hypothetical protein
MLLLVLVALFAAGAAAVPVRALNSVSCPVGDPRTVDPDFLGGRKPLTDPFVIGCPVLRRQGRLELVAYRAGPTLARSSLCVTTIFDRGALSGSCNSPDFIPRRLHFLLFSDGERAWYIHGVVPKRAVRVTARYRSFGMARRSRAIVVRVSDSTLLNRLHLRSRFSYYSAEASFHAKDVVLIARSQTGNVVDRIDVGTLSRS